jgi:UDP-N-acetylglucosamine--N-acetylmuramyl-(pentapeptide) pyrophosphoryl-undecaprenol N-acetylglucosamine transferase
MICITGGGTGGHLVIAKAIKEELNKRGIKPIFIGSDYGQDKAWFENDDGFSEKYFFHTSGVVNKRGFKKIFSLLNIIKFSFKTRQIFKKHNIKKVFSVGGYSSAPASLGAILFGKELFIHEQNAYMGNLNRVLKPFAKRVFSSFEYNDPYPIREEFFKYARERSELKTVLFLGGSQGAKAINELAMSIAKEMNIKIIHQTGKNDFERVKKFYEENNIKADVFDFSNNIIEKIALADFAVSRAGASSLFELSANQIPTLFIPYPYAANNHQYFNAKYLFDKSLCYLLEEKELNKDKVLEILHNIDFSISKSLKDSSTRNGSNQIVNNILNS